jgi:hypothetical protein
VAVYSVPVDGTEAKMEHRACVAASDLPDYIGPDDNCANPRFSYQLSGDWGATWVDYSPDLHCDDPVREPPCWVKVTLQYDFRLLVPINMEILGVRYGIPSTLAFERSSIFAMTDLELEP